MKKKNERERERVKYTPLNIYVLYTAMMAVLCVLWQWPGWTLSTLVFGFLSVIIITYVYGYDSNIAQHFTTIMGWVNIFLFVLNYENVLGILATVACACVVQSLYEKRQIMSIAVGFSLLIATISIGKLILSGSVSEVLFTTIVQFLTVFILEFIVVMLMNERIISKRDIDSLNKNLAHSEMMKSSFMKNISAGIENSPGEIFSLVNDIHQLSVLEDGGDPVEETEYTMAEIFKRFFEDMNTNKNFKDIIFIFDVEHDMPAALYGDAKKVYQIISKMTLSAFPFTQTGGIVVTIKARREAYGVNLMITVSDTGVGAEKDVLNNIYSVYAADSDDMEKIRVRTNLAIASKLTEKMNGNIHMSSVLGSGSTVSAVIPQKVKEEGKCAYVNEPENIRSVFYIDTEKVSHVKIKDGYMSCVSNIRQILGISCVKANTLAELRRRISTEVITHIFISYREYMGNREYFDNISRFRKVVVIADYEDDFTDASEYLVVAFMPFSVYTAADIFNGNEITTARISLLKQKLKISNDAYSVYEGKGKEIQLLNELEEENFTLSNQIDIVSLEEIDGLDTGVGMQYADNDRDEYLNLLSLFIIDSLRTNEDLNYAFRNKKAGVYRALAHNLKSSLKIIGAGECAEKAGRLENAAACDDWDYLKQNHKEFIDQFIKLCMDLRLKTKAGGE